MSWLQEAYSIMTGFSVINIQFYIWFFTPHVISYVSLSLQIYSMFLNRVIPAYTEKKWPLQLPAQRASQTVFYRNP